MGNVKTDTFDTTGPLMTPLDRKLAFLSKTPIQTLWKSLKLSVFHENVTKMSHFEMSDLSVTFLRKLTKNGFFGVFHEILTFLTLFLKTHGKT